MTKAIPVRFLVRYDPVILELVRRVRSGAWGDTVGASIQGCVSTFDDAMDLVAALPHVFGFPLSGSCNRTADLVSVILVYRDRFAMTADIAIAPAALGSRPFMIVGSLNCRRTLVEFRLGTEKSLSCAGADSSVIRLPLAEGDGELYRNLDLASGPVIVAEADDSRALALVHSLAMTGRMG